MLQKIFKKLKFWQWDANAWLRLLIILAPLVLVLPHTIGWQKYNYITLFDQRVYDSRLQWFTANNQSDERIVIIDIDEKSLSKYGRWPWRRDIIAQLSQKLLQQQQVALFGFDMLFTEPEVMPSPGTPEQQSIVGQEHDLQLVNSLNLQPVILGYHISDNSEGGENGTLSPPLTLRSIINKNLSDNNSLYKPAKKASLQKIAIPNTLLHIHSYTANISEIVEATAGGGFINVLLDSDGEIRSIPLVAKKITRYGAKYYPSLSLAMFLHILNQPKISLASKTTPFTKRPIMDGLNLHQNGSSLHIPTNIQGAMLLPYRGKGGKNNGQFQYISAADILDGKLPVNKLHGRIALLGSSAAGLHDLHVTPVNIKYPGVEVHATALSAMLDGNFIYTPDYASGYSAVITLLAVLLLAIVLPKAGPWGSWLWCLGLSITITSLNFWFYVQANVALPLAAGIVAIFISYILYMFYAFAREYSARKNLVTQLSNYIPPELVHTIVNQPAKYTAQTQTRELSIMFCDVRDFTKMAESIDPMKVQELLQRLFNPITNIIIENNGTIDKYIGDSVMAFWGSSSKLTNHADQAIQTATKMIEMLKQFNLEQTKLPSIQLSIGINSGIVSVGDIGSSSRRSYTVLGDAVNLASRIEPSNRIYGTAIIAGERTVELAPNINWQWVDCVRVPGREQAVQIYTPFDVISIDSELNSMQQRELECWQNYHEAYVQKNWKKCHDITNYLMLMRPDKKLYNTHNERISAFLSLPPGDQWDGVTKQFK